MFWGLRLFIAPTPAPGHAVVVVDAVAGGGDFSRLFGAEAVAAPDVPPPESTRFKLVGVLAEPDTEGESGVALVSIDGKPPRPYRVGAPIEDRLTLQAVGVRSASFGPAQGATSFTLEAPRMAEPATGTLSPVDASQLQVSPPPAVQAPVAPQPSAPPSTNAGQADGQPIGPAVTPPSTTTRPFRPNGGPDPYQR